MFGKARIRLGLAAIILPLLLIGLSQCSARQEEMPVIDEVRKTYIVVLDPGHGGRDVGAAGINGLPEKEFTLSLAQKVRDLFGKEEQIQVYMTRDDDTFISTQDGFRPNYANNLKADLFVSIHGNSFSSASVSGTESYYHDLSSRQFAAIVHKHVARATGLRDRGLRRKDLFVLRDTHMPAVLLEIGYLTNPHDERLLGDENFQEKVAEAVVRGVKEYLRIP